MEEVDPSATSERDSLCEGLRVLARIIARRHRRDTGEHGTRKEPDHGVSGEGAGQHSQAGDNNPAA